MSQSTGSNTIRLTQPGAGQTVNIPVNQDGMRMALGFEPDPNAVAKNGQDLEFSFEDGGKIVLEGYYDHFANKTLPVMVTESGDELPGEDFLASLNEDLLTAAGPGAGGAAGSGGSGDYADDAGALIDGISRLGKLGTIYWDRETEVPEEYSGTDEQPGGIFGLTVTTDYPDGAGSMFSLGLYEDAKPTQHIDGHDGAALMPGRINFNPELTGSTVVDEVRLSGFPDGTVIEIGQPGEPGYIRFESNGEGDVFAFTHDNFTTNGVYVTPPLNTDADFRINAEVDIRAESSGSRGQLTGGFDVVVDAVADKPTVQVADFANDNQAGHMDVDAIESKGADYANGRVTVGHGESGDEQLTVSIPYTTKIKFGDFLEDASEAHYALIQVPAQPVGASWRCVDANGVAYDVLVINADGYALDADGNPYGSPTGEPGTYFRVPVDNGDIDPATGEVTVNVTLEVSGTTAEVNDAPQNLKVGGMAEEQVAPGESELDWGNNTAFDWKGNGAHLDLDVIDSTLNISAGWASEGNKNDSHLTPTQGVNNPAQSYSPDWGAMDNGVGITDKASTGANGAPINVSLTGAQNNPEYITKATFTFEEGRGDICFDGKALDDGGLYDGYTYTDAAGTTYTFAVETTSQGTQVTVTVGGTHTDTLDNLNLTFKPATSGDQSHNDNDVRLDYSVEVANGTGVTGEYTGATEVVIDAVADAATDMSGLAGYNKDGDFQQTAAREGDTVGLTFTATFPDQDGSEDHVLYIRISNQYSSHNYTNAINGDNLEGYEASKNAPKWSGGYKYDIISKNAEYLEINVNDVLGANYPADIPAGGIGPVDVPGYPGVQLTCDASGKLTVTGVEVTLNGNIPSSSHASGDRWLNYDVVAWSKEGADETLVAGGGNLAADNEHDAGNNNAFNWSAGSVRVGIVSTDDSDFRIGRGKGFENNEPHNNVKGTIDPDAHGNEGLDSSDKISLPITWGSNGSHNDFKLGEGEEYVKVLTIKIPTDAFGNPVGNLSYSGPGASLTTTDGGITWTLTFNDSASSSAFKGNDLVFTPTGHSSGMQNLEVSATVVDGRSGDSETIKLDNLPVAIDAVANRSGEVTGAENGLNDGKYYAVHENEDGGKFFAFEPGDKITGVISTIFADNDDSERHYVLVEKLPNWKAGDTSYDTQFYNLSGQDGDVHEYFKVPVPTLGELSATDKAALLTGETVTVNGVKITLVDPSAGLGGEWKVEVPYELQPPALGEGSYDLKYGSVAEEYAANHATENHEDTYKNNNTAVRPGEGSLVVVIDKPGYIAVDADFVFEGNMAQPDLSQTPNPVVTIRPSQTGQDLLEGDMTVTVTAAGEVVISYQGIDGEWHALVDGAAAVNVNYPVPGTIKLEDGKVIFDAADDLARYGELQLKIEPKDGTMYHDDITISVDGTIYNTKTDQTTDRDDQTGKLDVDAVVQDPSFAGLANGGAEVTDSTVWHDPSYQPNGPSDPNTGKVTLTAEFTDMDGSTGHSILVEMVAGLSYSVDGKPLTVVVEHDGKLYYKVPVPNDGWDGNKGSVEVEVTYNNGDGKFSYGAMSEDITGSGGAPARAPGDAEETYENNVAIVVGGDVQLDVLGGGSGPSLPIVTVYEDNRPGAHLDPDAPEVYGELDLSGLKTSYGATQVEITLPGEGAMFYSDPECTIPLGGYGQTVTVSTDQKVYVKVDPGYSDKDINYSFKVVDGDAAGQTGHGEIMVDAVAQQTESVTAAVQYESKDGGTEYYSYVGEGPVTVNVTVEGFVDTDSGTTNYVLIEAKPGWECKNPGAEMVNVTDPKTGEEGTYYRIPVDNSDIVGGKITIPVIMDSPSGDQLDGESFKTGSMVIDRPSDMEADISNNISVNINEESITIKKDVVEETVGLKIEYGVEDSAPAFITVTGVDGSDDVTQMVFSIDGSKGTFVFNDVKIPAGTNVTEGGLKFTWDNGKLVVEAVDSSKDVSDLLNSGKFGVSSNGYSSDDINITWSYTAQNGNSGHTVTSGDKGSVAVIDAEAHAPKTENVKAVYGDNGEKAVGSDSNVKLSADVTYTYVEAETPYVLVQYYPGWEPQGVTLTINGITLTFTGAEMANLPFFHAIDGSGNVYYQIPLSKDGNTSLVDYLNGLSESAKDSFTVHVEAELKTPAGITSDTDRELNVGGMVVDSYTQGDGEPSSANNIKVHTEGETVYIAEVETTAIKAPSVTVTEDNNATISLSIDKAVERNEEIIKIEFAGPADGTGVIYYNGTPCYPDSVTGKIVIDPFDGSKVLEFRPETGWSGTYKPNVTATVQDKGSLDTVEISKTVTVTVTGSASDSTPNEATGSFDAVDSGVYTLKLSAVFDDNDGSEQHYFLVKLPDGLHLEGEYDIIDGADYSASLSGNYYVIPANGASAAELDIRQVGDWDGTGVEFHSASVENATVNISDAKTAAIPDAFDYVTNLVEGTNVGEILNGTGEADLIFAYGGDDTVNAGAGDDVIFANSGTNLIYGGAGNDEMHGGDGADVFAWTGDDLGGMDTILDFEMDKDALLFETLFGGAKLEGDALTEALTDMITDKTLDIMTSGDGMDVTLKMGDQTVNISLAGEGLNGIEGGSGYLDMGAYNSGDDASAKAALIEMMITQVTS